MLIWEQGTIHCWANYIEGFEKLKVSGKGEFSQKEEGTNSKNSMTLPLCLGGWLWKLLAKMIRVPLLGRLSVLEHRKDTKQKHYVT